MHQIRKQRVDARRLAFLVARSEELSSQGDVEAASILRRRITEARAALTDIERDRAGSDDADRATALAMSYERPPQLDAKQIEFLIRRSQELISEGDVGAARSLLQRAAEARDPRAALALGATYDPVMLAILGAHGIAADASLARDWYIKAREFGSREAQARLDLLAAPPFDLAGPAANGELNR